MAGWNFNIRKKAQEATASPSPSPAPSPKPETVTERLLRRLRKPGYGSDNWPKPGDIEGN